MSSFLKKECDLTYFHENRYLRKKCKKCGAYYWTLDRNSDLCGDQPCVNFTFIEKPLGKKPFSLSEVRESFLSFFEKNNHSRLCYPVTQERFPVVARWRTDIYLTIASIADFQPHVTSGEVPPPANPLVISQPCIRLNDLEEVGKSGRHLTTFEMMGHHAFNKETDEIYFKEETVRLCDKYFTEEIGIPRKKINYKEQLWVGGGNAGPCLEVLAGGLEIATLVFMNMKEDANGDFEIDNVKYSKNPLNIVDTGYGLERIAWCTKGTKTVYETVFPELLDWIKQNLGGKISDMQSYYSLADHAKCLAFMLGDGIVPSNVKAGYLARLIIRRSLRFIKKLELKKSLREVVAFQLDILEKEFPSLVKEREKIGEILDIESEKYHETLSKGKNLVKRILKDKEKIDAQKLIMLYDTHGMPPDIVKKIGADQGVKVQIPKNFDSMIAELHSHEKKVEKEESGEDKEISDLNTKPLYYQDHYAKSFDAEVIWKKNNGDKTEVILDQTVFYPEGGGQPGDKGILRAEGKEITVEKVWKKDDAIIHTLKKDLKVGDKVHGEIDWDHRYTLMKHHTGTHLINGALRKILGEHVWQAGSQLGLNEARFDYVHYQSLSDEETKSIEKLANQLIEQKINVEKKVMDRNSAEKKYGFRLYQGGVPPGNSIRVLHIPNVDVEACGGTHLNNTGEIEKIKVIKTEKIQDGVNRIVFAAGAMAEVFKDKEKEIYNDLVKKLEENYEIKNHGNTTEELRKVCEIFSVQTNQIDNTLDRFLKESEIDKKQTVDTLSQACNDLFNHWKKTMKMKKKISSDEIKNLLDEADVIPDTDVKVITGKSSSKGENLAGKLIENGGIVAHIYDGDKIVSMASKNVDIDLRDISREIGKLLGGGGGGKPKMVQSGGPNKEKINEALKIAKKMTIEKISG